MLLFSSPHLYAAASLTSITSRKEALPSSSVWGTSICRPTSPSLLLVFAVGRTGSVGGSVEGLTTDDVSVDEELVTGVSVETSLTVLGDNWSDDTVVVFEVEIIEVDTADTFTRVPVTLVGFKTSREVITPITVNDVAGILIDDNFKSTDDDSTLTSEV